MKQKQQPERRWLQRQAAAEYLDMSGEWFDDNIAGHIPWIHIGNKYNSPVFYDRKDIDEYMDGLKQAATPVNMRKVDTRKKSQSCCN